jgi:cell division protein FtsI (penicillin-binding protein 3)
MVSREKAMINRLLIGITVIYAVTVFIRILFLMVAGPSAESTYDNPSVAHQVIRGSITDRNGNLLAVEVPYWSCALSLSDVADLTQVATQLEHLLSIDAQTIISEANQRSQYYLVKRHLTETERRALEQAQLNGVRIEKRYGRAYPQQHHAAQIIGFTNVENRGIEGLELAYEQELFPYPELQTEITRGNDIEVTLDMDLQYLLDLQAEAINREHYPDSLVGIIMGAQSGEILAATSYPWYDPNTYQQSDIESRQNKVITARYEPGSVFKIFSLAAELQAGDADVDEPFYCDGTYTFTTPQGNETTINCVTAHHMVNVQTMIAYSCNGAVAHWALQTEDQKLYDILSELGFNTVWDTGMLGGVAGTLAPPSTWSGRSKATISFGQEIATTALHIVTAATALATQGSVMQPYIIKTIRDADGVIQYQREPQVARAQVFSPEVTKQVLEGMVLATQPGGTATRTAVPGVAVAAKTGTAQLIDPETGNYETNRSLASTIAIVPAENPQYIIYIGAINPKGNTIWGSNIAGPAVGAIIADMVRQGKLSSSAMERVTTYESESPLT